MSILQRKENEALNTFIRKMLKLQKNQFPDLRFSVDKAERVIEIPKVYENTIKSRIMEFAVLSRRLRFTIISVENVGETVIKEIPSNDKGVVLGPTIYPINTDVSKPVEVKTVSEGENIVEGWKMPKSWKDIEGHSMVEIARKDQDLYAVILKNNYVFEDGELLKATKTVKEMIAHFKNIKIALD